MRKGIAKKIVLATILTMFLTTIYGFIVEPNILIMISKITIEINGLPSCFNGFRIVQISDLHFGSFKLNVREWIILSKIKTLKPDIIVVTGDFVSKVTAMEEALDFVEKLANIAPVFVVFGNWDWWSLIDLSEFKEKLKSIPNVTVLNNIYSKLNRECGTIFIVGVDDPYTSKANLGKALEDIPANSVKILLAHSPQIIDEAKGKVQLVLAGHTHGGQIVLPIIGPPFIPLPSKYRKYVAGLFIENGTYMYVSRGIGTSILPARFLSPPEIVLVILKS